MTEPLPKGSERVSIRWRGREVNREPWRTLAALLGLLAAVGGIVLAVFALALTMVMLAVCIVFGVPAHLLLLALGRRGFAVNYPDGTFSFEINRKGFAKHD